MGRVSSQAVSSWTRSSGCCAFRGVFRAGRIFPCFSLFLFFFFFERARPAAIMRPPCLIYLSISTGVRTGCHYLISLSECVCVCVTFVVFADCVSCTRPISTNKPGIYGSGRVWANAWDVVFRAPSRGGHGRWADVGFVVCLRWGGIFSCFP